ncbi:WD40 repeat domain-containing protein [Solirubrobacter ginsenosidimutans]|uniref:WD40 repeat domain-containing protein n=1 Tax=Solirubrobacter ginsenosidimutans TaxID=490573 RepID=UPI00355736BC
MREIRGHGAGVRAVAFAAGGTILATGGDDDSIRLRAHEGDRAAGAARELNAHFPTPARSPVV